MTYKQLQETARQKKSTPVATILDLNKEELDALFHDLSGNVVPAALLAALHRCLARFCPTMDECVTQ